MMLVEVTAPALEALPVAGLRDHLRLGTGFEMAGDAAETAALAGFLRAAMATIEARTGKALLVRQFRLRLEEWRDPMGQPLPLAPVAAIERVEIDDGAGNLTLVDPASYRLQPDMQRPVLAPVGAFLPQIPCGGHVTITFRAGFGPQWSDVPADLAQAVLMLAARYHEDRSFEGTQSAIPFGVSALIERWRSVRVLGGRGNSRGRA
ncbi:head-tail connector protein [Paracoccus lutimaris]|uniref:Putative phiE125 gp8 family phage protein n=1 Tax=Paracoccus lutimaris TaxID=1490030 RepID=A0A368Z020_9RHOB|nr:phage head-tail connector protein [Paracoccus lutimaris]RCW85781.1 putative phiE125 gp8 family phage protein [Paracoccus lutimaris]